MPKFSGGGEAFISHSLLSCPVCGGAAHIKDGMYDFSKYVEKELSNIRLSRQQKRRYIQAVEKANDFKNLPVVAAAIDPALGKVTAEAVKQENPKSCLDIVKNFIRNHWVAIAIGGAPAILSGLELKDRWFPELEETQSERRIDAQESQSNPDNETQNDSNGDSHDRSNNYNPKQGSGLWKGVTDV